jgi:Zn-dependent alcohol dehydrogenase
MKTRAAVIRAVGKDWDLVEVDLDEPKAGEVVVRMTAAGICHSDDHYRPGDSVPSDEMVAAIRARGGTARQLFPLIGGHEGAGIVEKVGPEVHTLAVGDHAAVSFVPACGRCRWCVTGLQLHLRPGSRALPDRDGDGGTNRRFLDGDPVLAMMQVGTFSEHVVAAEDSFIKSRALRTTAARSSQVHLDHPPSSNAVLAAPTARSASTEVESGTDPMISSVEGLSTRIRRGESESRS